MIDKEIKDYIDKKIEEIRDEMPYIDEDEICKRIWYEGDRWDLGDVLFYLEKGWDEIHTLIEKIEEIERVIEKID